MLSRLVHPLHDFFLLCRPGYSDTDSRNLPPSSVCREFRDWQFIEAQACGEDRAAWQVASNRHSLSSVLQLLIRCVSPQLSELDRMAESRHVQHLLELARELREVSPAVSHLLSHAATTESLALLGTTESIRGLVCPHCHFVSDLAFEEKILKSASATICASCSSIFDLNGRRPIRKRKGGQAEGTLGVPTAVKRVRVAAAEEPEGGSVAVTTSAIEDGFAAALPATFGPRAGAVAGSQRPSKAEGGSGSLATMLDTMEPRGSSSAPLAGLSATSVAISAQAVATTADAASTAAAAPTLAALPGSKKDKKAKGRDAAAAAAPPPQPASRLFSLLDGPGGMVPSKPGVGGFGGTGAQAVPGDKAAKPALAPFGLFAAAAPPQSTAQPFSFRGKR